MSSCCGDPSCETKPATVASEVCATCGSKGVRVDPITLKALFTPAALRRGVPSDPRFCPETECPVVYFDNAAAVVFTEDDLIVRVHAKHPGEDEVPVCYCFEHSPGTIRREIEQTGSSTASKTITAEVKAGHCACEVKNPRGVCCLGDVARAEKEVRAWQEKEKQSSANPI